MSAGVGQLITDLRADPLALPLSSFFAAVLQSDLSQVISGANQ
jgi:hypothetical protein